VGVKRGEFDRWVYNRLKQTGKQVRR